MAESTESFSVNARLLQILWIFTSTFLASGGGCRIRDTEAPEESHVSDDAVTSSTIHAGRWSEIGDEYEIDPNIDAIIQPYRGKLQAVMEEVVASADATFVRGLPESPLGNFVADTILRHAQQAIDAETKIALMNRGGIRLPELPTGAITVADIYQLVPFDNRIVVLTLTGTQVETLVQALAVHQGEPFSGMKYQLEQKPDSKAGGSWIATMIEVNGAALIPDETYKLATLDYLAGIGGEHAVLQEASQRQDGRLFLRDVMIQDLRQQRTITPVIDGRVSYTNQPQE